MNNIDKFAKKPKLIKITIEQPEITEYYDGPVIFYIMDSLDINTYFDFYRSQSDKDGDQLNMMLRKLILNEHGKPCIPDEHMLPVDLSLAALGAINEHLGKSRTKPSTQNSGNQQD